MMEPLIRIEDVHFAYPAEDEKSKPAEVLKGITLSFEHGELVAV